MMRKIDEINKNNNSLEYNMDVEYEIKVREYHRGSSTYFISLLFNFFNKQRTLQL